MDPNLGVLLVVMIIISLLARGMSAAAYLAAKATKKEAVAGHILNLFSTYFGIIAAAIVIFWAICDSRQFGQALLCFMGLG